MKNVEGKKRLIKDIKAILDSGDLWGENVSDQETFNKLEENINKRNFSKKYIINLLKPEYQTILEIARDVDCKDYEVFVGICVNILSGEIVNDISNRYNWYLDHTATYEIR
jgi:hypothetical protein